MPVKKGPSHHSYKPLEKMTNKQSKLRKIRQIRDELILNAIADGKSLDVLHKENPDIVPTSLEVCKMIETNDDFKSKVYQARKVLSNRLVEKLHYLRDNPPIASDYDDAKQYVVAYNIWTKQLKSVHDEIHQLGSIYNEKFIKLQKIDQSEKITVQQVSIIDYANQKKEELSVLPKPKDDNIEDNQSDNPTITH